MVGCHSAARCLMETALLKWMRVLFWPHIAHWYHRTWWWHCSDKPPFCFVNFGVDTFNFHEIFYCKLVIFFFPHHALHIWTLSVFFHSVCTMHCSFTTRYFPSVQTIIHCILCGPFIVDTSLPRFNHFFLTTIHYSFFTVSTRPHCGTIQIWLVGVYD